MTEQAQTMTIEAELAHAISNGPAAITPDLIQRARDEISSLRAEILQVTEERAQYFAERDQLETALNEVRAEMQLMTEERDFSERQVTAATNGARRIEAALRDQTVQFRQLVKQWRNEAEKPERAGIWFTVEMKCAADLEALIDRPRPQADLLA